MAHPSLPPHARAAQRSPVLSPPAGPGLLRRVLPHLRRMEPTQVLLWVPLLASLLGTAILLGLGRATPVYLGILASIVAFDLLALFGPVRARPALLVAAPLAYLGFLLAAWLVALYVLPGHPASPMVRLAAALYTTIIYVFLFVQHPPRPAARRSGAALALFVLVTLPHAARTLGGVGAFDSVTLPLTLLLSHGALILVLRSFSRARDQLTQAQAREQALYELAHHDALTGLPNRRALEQDLAQAVGQPGGHCLLAVIDVDGLKRVNDRRGHAVGDDLLRRFASGFADGVSATGRAYRLSGDEFALLLGGVGPERAERLVGDVADQVREVYPEAGASVGTARLRPGESASAWLSRADRAMYRHKRRTQEEGGGGGRSPT